MWDFLWTGMFLGKHLNKLLIENLKVFHNSNFFQGFFWNFGYRTNMETFPAARKLGDVTDWPCDQCISEVSLDGCVDSSRSFCWSLKGFIDKVADVHFLHQGEALRLQRPPVHFCVDGCCWKKHSDKAILNDDSIRPALVNLLAAASICLKLGLETWGRCQINAIFIVVWCV